MEPFTTHTGVAAPLHRANVDTDQIIPAVYLKRITRTGFADALFITWRADPDFVLNRPPYAQASILAVGPDFGTGSSREHAVWALQDYGFKAVVGTSFGPIFTNNAGKAGLVLARLTPEAMDEFWAALAEAPGVPMTVDLVDRTARLGERAWPFAIDDYTRARLLAGLDDIGATLRREADIAAYEATRPHYRPSTL